MTVRPAGAAALSSAIDPFLEKGLPSNVEAERSILGAILLDNAVCNRAIELLRREDLFLDSHRRIFDKMIALTERLMPIDLITLSDELRRAGEFEQIGGATYIASLIDGVPRTDTIEPYADLVRRASREREILALNDLTTTQVMSGDYDPANLLTTLNRMVSAATAIGVPAETKSLFVTAAQIAGEGPQNVQWIVRPWLAEGSITEICGKIKMAGKTTFALAMAKAIVKGAPFLGVPTRRGSVVYLTEQPPSSFRQALRRAGLLESDQLHVLFRHSVQGRAWSEVAMLAKIRAAEIGASTLIVDTLPQFAGFNNDEENNTGAALRTFEPLQQSAAQGLAVLVIRHERKAGGAVGESSRGATAFGGVVDVIMSLRRGEGQTKPEVRVIHALSRFEATPDVCVVELTDQGYVFLGSETEVALQRARERILEILSGFEAGATLVELLAQAGEGLKKTIAQTALNLLSEAGKLEKLGRGKKGDPYRFILSAAYRDGSCGRNDLGSLPPTTDNSDFDRTSENGSATTAIPISGRTHSVGATL